MRASNDDQPVNRLLFGDNLEILRSTAIADRSVDLIYLDPPFNSQAQYNVLFRSPREDSSSAQAGAFVDTWTWGDEAELSYAEIMKIGGGVAKFIDALKAALGDSDMMAYLVMMAVRLDALRSKLKHTGSLYLHCDPTASHYLKVLLDGIFGFRSFRNEIVWKRANAHNDAKGYGRISDTLLFYTASEKYTWNTQHTPYRQEYYESHFKKDAAGRYYRTVPVDAPRHGQGAPGLLYDWKGKMPAASRTWAIKRDKMEEYEAKGLLRYTRTGTPTLIQYADEMKGVALQNIWTDVPPVNPQARERLGYPTQKPVALLERIIKSSSNEGDLVLDPFCGCGTTVEAAHNAGRNWLGIDIAIHAIKVIEARLDRQFPRLQYKVEGIPKDFPSAIRLAQADKYQFQWWANYLFNPHALREQKKGADRGVDGDVFFPNGPGKPWGRMLTSVKGGDNVGPSMVRDFARVVERDRAEMGLFICLYRPTREMQREAASAGIADTVHGHIPRLQIVAIEDWFKGKLPMLPPLEHLPSAAFSTARRRPSLSAPAPDPQQPELPLSYVGGKQSRSTVVHLNRSMVHAGA